MFKDSLEMFEYGILNEWRHWEEPSELPPKNEWDLRKNTNEPPKIFGMWRAQRDGRKRLDALEKVANGIILERGGCVIEWCMDGYHSSVVVFKSFRQFVETHILSHPDNKTRLVWRDYRGYWHDAYRPLDGTSEGIFGSKLREYMIDKGMIQERRFARDVILNHWKKIWRK